MQEGRAKAGEGFDRASFVVDWDAHTVTCPAGKQNYSWLPYDDPDKALAEARARTICQSRLHTVSVAFPLHEKKNCPP
jgi:hypothetical protein